MGSPNMNEEDAIGGLEADGTEASTSQEESKTTMSISEEWLQRWEERLLNGIEMQLKREVSNIREEIIENRNEMNNCKKLLHDDINNLEREIEKKGEKWQNGKQEIDKKLEKIDNKLREQDKRERYYRKEMELRIENTSKKQSTGVEEELRRLKA